jgi:hypothetical protein
MMILVVPTLAFPVLGRNPGFGPDLRASNADREVAADMLCAAVADGRLTLAELDERLEGVLAARTLREIARWIADLPGAPFAAQARPRPPRPAAPSPALTRWSLLQSLVTVSPSG